MWALVVVARERVQASRGRRPGLGSLTKMSGPISADVLPSLSLPEIQFTHDRWEHRTASLWDRVRGKQLLLVNGPRKPIVLLAGDPRDVMVSLFLHMSKRSHPRGRMFPPRACLLLCVPRCNRFRCPKVAPRIIRMVSSRRLANKPYYLPKVLKTRFIKWNIVLGRPSDPILA